MAQQTLIWEGTFTTDQRDALNEMLTEIYAVTSVAGAAGSATAAYPKTTSGAQTLLAAATVDRRVIISVQVTTVFADGDGAQPTFEIGQTGETDKFAATTLFTGAAAGATFSLAGTLTANTALLVTATAATGTTSTGALAVTAIASAA